MAKRVALKIQIGLYIAIIINLLIYHHCTKNGKTKLIFKETLRNKLQRKTKCNNFVLVRIQTFWQFFNTSSEINTTVDMSDCDNLRVTTKADLLLNNTQQ